MVPKGQEIRPHLAADALATISWIAAVAVISFASAYPAVRALVATARMEPVRHQVIINNDLQVRAELRRQIQKHYLNYGIYVPVEDIMFRDQVLQLNQSLESSVHHYCSDAVLGIWVPLKFRLPLMGERVVEWCWKPVIRK